MSINQNEYIAALEELFQFRQDLQFMPEHQRHQVITPDLLGQARSIRQRIERGLGVASSEDEGGLMGGPDGLSRTSMLLDLFTETGRWISRARQRNPELFDKHFGHEERPFGFAAGLVSR